MQRNFSNATNYFNDETTRPLPGFPSPTSEVGQMRRFDPQPVTSGLPQSTDIARPARLVRFVPILLQKSVEGFCEQ